MSTTLYWKAYCPKEGCKRSTAKPFKATGEPELINNVDRLSVADASKAFAITIGYKKILNTP